MRTSIALSAAPLALLLLFAGCRAQETLGTNAGSPAGGTPPAAAPGATGSPAPVQTATLTGLYEGPPAAQRSRMCVIERGADARFGVVLWSTPTESCSATGTAARRGDVLRLTLGGDESCTIDARIEGTGVTFPASLPAGCAYYCSRGARFAGAAFDKTGGSEADAMRAEGLAGDRLCAG